MKRLLCALLAVVLTSCGGETGPSLVEIRVMGTVLDQGVPVPGVTITIFWYDPTPGSPLPGDVEPAIVGRSDANGDFDVTYEVNFCATSRVYASFTGALWPAGPGLRSDLLTGCGPHQADIDAPA